MTGVSKQELRSSLNTRLKLLCVDHDALFSSAVEVVIFGSRAAGVNSDTSDLDVLCFTQYKRRMKTSQLDCICYPHEEMGSPYWLGCELASHIAHYGVWIMGSGAWCNSVHIGDAAITRKQRKVLSLVVNAYSRWRQFHPLFRVKYVTSIRRELQRLCLLQAAVPVPPTPVLDSQWNSHQTKPERLLSVAGDVSGLPHAYADWICSILERDTLAEGVCGGMRVARTSSLRSPG